ncbi:7090_t:CDS:2 [Funneliformis geosporum]|uniref:Folliculin n=1 Tax=Funneliformis geosporum TaxID=1117311 RepID=A0A9W4WUU1_9GLOM|nr:7090_t:CDS:2 [Funneliformis geosporum]
MIATDIQSKANLVFEKEDTAKEERNDGTFVTRSGPLPPTSPDQFLRRRANQPLRSLVDLLKSKDLFVKLHANFSWILKACGRRLQESHVNDQTLFPSSVFSPKTLMLLDPMTTYQPPPFGLNGLKGDNEVMIGDLKALQSILGLNAFRKLILNFVKGNQLVIRGNDPIILRCLINILKDFVPSECCSIVENENNYQPLTKYNILGLNATAQIPNHINKSTLYCDTLKDDKTVMNTFKFNIQYGFDDNRNHSAPNSFINQLTGILKLNLPNELMNIRLMIFKEQWSCKAKQFLRFVTGNINGGNVLPNIDLTKQIEFIKLIDINENDLPIVRFWTGCLNTK